jgi:hypothetical protein
MRPLQSNLAGVVDPRHPVLGLGRDSERQLLQMVCESGLRVVNGPQAEAALWHHSSTNTAASVLAQLRQHDKHKDGPNLEYVTVGSAAAGTAARIPMLGNALIVRLSERFDARVFVFDSRKRPFVAGTTNNNNVVGLVHLHPYNTGMGNNDSSARWLVLAIDHAATVQPLPSSPTPPPAPPPPPPPADAPQPPASATVRVDINTTRPVLRLDVTRAQFVEAQKLQGTYRDPRAVDKAALTVSFEEQVKANWFVLFSLFHADF